MKKLLLAAALFIAIAMPAVSAEAQVVVPPPVVMPIVEMGGAAAIGWTFPIAVVSGAAAVVLIANQVDPWHPLACYLFGNQARVGNEHEAHCN